MDDASISNEDARNMEMTCSYPACGVSQYTANRVFAYCPCRTARYCGPSHQKLHWSSHRSQHRREMALQESESSQASGVHPDLTAHGLAELMRQFNQAYSSALFDMAFSGSLDVAQRGRMSREAVDDLRLMIELQLKPGVDLTVATGANAFRMTGCRAWSAAQFREERPSLVEVVDQVLAREVPQGCLGFMFAVVQCGSTRRLIPNPYGPETLAKVFQPNPHWMESLAAIIASGGGSYAFRQSLFASLIHMKCTARCLTQCRRYATETNKVPLPRERPPPLPFSLSPKPEIRNDALSDELQQILLSFQAPVQHALAYGSGVYKQASYSSNAQPMLDFIFVVSHAAHWHDINMAQHPRHYSPQARLFGSTFAGWAQEHWGAGVWYNIDCVVNKRRIKYGVIDVNSICADLLDWKTLYCAGRLHKPIATLKSSARVQAANQANLASALRTALLLLPESFSEAELYETIAGLSYRGDPRMGVAENPAKVRNIVSAQMEHFQRLYAPFVAEAGVHRSGKAWEQDGSVEAMSGRVENLPVGLKDRIRADYERTARFEAKDGSDEKGAVWRSVVQRPDFASMVSNGLKQIVGGSALSQSLKGVLTVGPWKGLQYLWPKIQKRFA